MQPATAPAGPWRVIAEWWWATPGALAFAIGVWRAAMLSITHDEATLYLRWIDQPLGALFRYEPVNHILNTWLAKATTLLFGPGELSLRLPALAGSLLFIASVAAICARLIEGQLGRCLVLTLIVLNPSMLDLYSVARGYSLALGFLFAACLFLIRDLEERRSATRKTLRSVAMASAALGFSCASTLAFVFISSGVVVGYLVADRLAVKASRPDAPPFTKLLQALILPGFFVTGCVLIPYASELAGSEYWGFTSPLDTVRDLANASFFRSVTAISAVESVPFGSALHARGYAAQEWAMGVAVPVSSAVAVCLLVAFLFLASRRLKGNVSPRDESILRAGILLTVALGSTAVLFVIAHATRGLPYPVDRFASYLVPFIVLIVACAYPFARWFGLPSAVLAVVAIGVWATGTDLRFFRTWRFDAGARGIADAVEREHRRLPRTQLTIAGTWTHAPALDFYRRVRHYTWLDPFVFMSAPRADLPDFFVFQPEERPMYDQRLFRQIADDPASGTVLLERERGQEAVHAD